METHENEPSYTKADVGDPVHHLWVCSRETMRTKQRRIAKYLASGSQMAASDAARDQRPPVVTVAVLGHA
jgi:hypothetical protein